MQKKNGTEKKRRQTFNQPKHMKSIVAHICRASIVIELAMYTDRMQAFHKENPNRCWLSLCRCRHVCGLCMQSGCFIHSFIHSLFIGVWNSFINVSGKKNKQNWCVLYIDFRFYRIDFQFALHFDTVCVSISRAFAAWLNRTHTSLLFSLWMICQPNKAQNEQRNVRTHRHLSSERERERVHSNTI